MSTHPLIEVKNVNYSYGSERVLEDITLSVERGTFLGIIGPNGSGKTTLLKVMLGLLKPQTGSVKLFGHSVVAFKEWPKIGYVPQRVVTSALHFPITVAEVVTMGDTKGLGSEAVKEALRAVNMLDYADKKLDELSGGQQQRVFIARSLVSKPELLILDEPTTGVDSESQVKFYQLLKDLNIKMKLTLVLITHDIDVVSKEVSEVACLNSKLVYHGKPKDALKTDFMNAVFGKELRVVSHNHS